MSQPFVCMLSVEGAPGDVAEFVEYFSRQWAEMKDENTILSGFRWVQTRQPKETYLAANKPQWKFFADGSCPEKYAAIISVAFPKIRVHLSAADSSRNEYLAVAIAAENGKFQNIDRTNDASRRYGLSNDELASVLLDAAAKLEIPQ
ncbi:hypothetical protein [Ectopseudomonas mendocina]|uniref:hypothetical protein n=1 Tax=Ectopseudomonas mendocina TaxID=300 RepID=UPI0012DA6FEE|nr:hypothetical protein [Pseudomonas mendocina]